jgi:two-component system, NtrC family, sensor kinase
VGTAGPALRADDAPLPLRRSLRGKGLAAMLALLAYVFAAGLYVAAGRGKVLASVTALATLSQHEKVLALAEAGVNTAQLDVDHAATPVGLPVALPADLLQALQASAVQLAALEPFDPAYALLLRSIERSYQSLAAAPQPAQWIDLREALGRAADELEIRRRRLAEERDSLSLAYQRQYDAVTVESLLLAVVGLALFGTLAAWFFSRLAGDIRRLEAHARQIVRGARGVALPVHRDDELGRLMRAVNRMATDLDEREKQIELDNQRRAHQDKMSSVGALAAGMAHEVNNPLAAISGAAQALRGAPPTAQQLDESTSLILAQADRAACDARQLAEVAAPEAAEADWIDLNALVRRVIQLTAYDRRYRHFRFETAALDPALPAVRAAGEALRQALTQILSLACDSMVAAACQPASLALATSATGSDIAVQVSLPPVLDFSRPAVQRTLTLCRAIIEQQGGRLALDQDDGPLLRLKLILSAEIGNEQG